MSASLCPQEQQRGAGQQPQRHSPPPHTGKLRVVVLGSGWGAVSFIKALSKRDRRAAALRSWRTAAAGD